MTGEYAYKYVSIKLGGELDWKALERARDKGWEPVPLDEMPDIEPPLGMGARQLEAFRLHRMPLDKHMAMRQDLEFLNAALASPLVQQGVAAKKTGGPFYDALLAEHEDDKDLRKQVEVAYAWLKERGLL